MHQFKLETEWLNNPNQLLIEINSGPRLHFFQYNWGLKSETAELLVSITDVVTTTPNMRPTHIKSVGNLPDGTNKDKTRVLLIKPASWHLHESSFDIWYLPRNLCRITASTW